MQTVIQILISYVVVAFECYSSSSSSSSPPPPFPFAPVLGILAFS
jgi:hypothetical protein